MTNANNNPYAHWTKIRKVCIVGAGTMGSGIAAHLQNLGFDVTLLDCTQSAAENGLHRATNSRPPHFYLPSDAQKIRVGGIDEHIAWAAEADWICEAVFEQMDVKHEVLEKLSRAVRPDALFSTNTSGLEIELLAEALPDSLRPRFMGTHFFNPPRYLKLLELIPSSYTDPLAVAAATEFFEQEVARRVVLALDTPGFIANRYGMWCMYKAIHATEKLGLSVEQVDAITGPFIGRPRTGSFRLNDIVGLDIMVDIASNIQKRCTDDPFLDVFETPKSMHFLLGKNWIGEKVGQGYYKREGKELLALDLTTMAYRVRRDPELRTIEEFGRVPLAERLKRGLAAPDETGEFLRAYLVPILAYADWLRPQISHSVQDFDRVMHWGFGWEMGPFAMCDAICSDVLKSVGGKLSTEQPFYKESMQLTSDNTTYVPVRDESEFKNLREYPLIQERATFNLRDLGDGVTAICATTKLGVFSPTYIDELTEYITNEVPGPYVLTTEDRAFSAGFDLKVIQSYIESGNSAGLEAALLKFQQLGHALSTKPGVAAVFGYCLGGGLEMAISCSEVVAAVETRIGFPEAKVGLIPGGRGTVLMRLFTQPDTKTMSEMAIRLAEGRVGSNAVEAKHLGFLRPTDHVEFHPDRLIHTAKRKALEAKVRPLPEWSPVVGPLVGRIDQDLEQFRAKGTFTEHDVEIGERIKVVFAKANDLENALERERREFVHLAEMALTQVRIRHMLETGNPMKN
jgi:3-hydroxyacyl-CoA dehydrogenase